MSEIISLKNIQVKVNVIDWEDSIRKAGVLLLNDNKIHEEYIERMIQSVESLGPYIVIMPGFALAHAEPSEKVIETSMSLITLDKPINFGSSNDPVEVVLCLASNDKTSHIEMLQSIAIKLMKEGVINEISKFTNKEELYEFINS